MNPMSASDKKQGIKAQLLGVLQNPTQLRVMVTGVVVVAAYAGLYLPLSSDIADTGQKLDKERLRLNLVREVQNCAGSLPASRIACRQSLIPTSGCSIFSAVCGNSR